MTQTFPPPGFIPTASAIPGIAVYAPAPEEAEARPEIVEFKCPQCQATTAYSVADGGLRCAHCGYYEPPAKPIVGKGAQEFEFTVETMAVASQAHGWGERARVQSGCNARATLPPGRLTHLPLLRLEPRAATRRATGRAAPALPDPLHDRGHLCRPIAGSGWAALDDAEIPQAIHRCRVYGHLPAHWTFDTVTRPTGKPKSGIRTRRATIRDQILGESHGHRLARESGVCASSSTICWFRNGKVEPRLLNNLINYDTQALVA